jgi:8-amino-7-oxononanoate synthase
VPAALFAPASGTAVASDVAKLQGCDRGSLGPSTFHLFWDFLGLLAESRSTIFMDEGLYPIGRWAVERAAARGALVAPFRHHDVGDLFRRFCRSAAKERRRPVVIADGFCPDCGRPAPIADYLEIARSRGGLLVLDDTQAVGILGHSPCPADPYGRGGGGSLRYCGVLSPDVILVSSLAKGFGVPAAVISGASAVIEDFDARSETRLHCSPPAAAVIHSAVHALAVNRERGDAARRRLAQLVRHFRRRLPHAGLHPAGSLFPVQSLRTAPGVDAAALHTHLLQLGIRAVVGRGRECSGARVRFVINARHSVLDIDRAIDALARAIDHFTASLIPWRAYNERNDRP